MTSADHDVVSLLTEHLGPDDIKEARQDYSKIKAAAALGRDVTAAREAVDSKWHLRISRAHSPKAKSLTWFELSSAPLEIDPLVALRKNLQASFPRGLDAHVQLSLMLRKNPKDQQLLRLLDTLTGIPRVFVEHLAFGPDDEPILAQPEYFAPVTNDPESLFRMYQPRMTPEDVLRAREHLLAWRALPEGPEKTSLAHILYMFLLRNSS